MSNLTTLDNEQLINKTADWVMEKLNFCGCGVPDWFVYYLYVYLDRVKKQEKLGEDEFQYSYKYRKDLIAYAYICDQQEWTEHGSSITYCWLTDNGKELLKKLKRIDWSDYKELLQFSQN